MAWDGFRDVTDARRAAVAEHSRCVVNIRFDTKVLTRAASPFFIISIPTLTKGCELHSRFKTN